MFLMMLKAFAVGGLICLIGQILIDNTKLTPAKILVGYVVVGVFLGAVGLYEPLTAWAGCGASVPLSGFGNLLVKGTREAIEEMGVLGILSGPIASGSIGISAAVLSGLCVSLLTKPKAK